ncbi:hypothetical protein, conserved [Eimeria tenella]|uniref:Uncharacterized protein n=1 Tax=Eimeria tenella TaxID=5802 RepID=U6KRR3_EIMTE|nr:hypothetical protein, conserved [Eimeria tenella]CDJ40661.1 hypothetical protein, conserved [Eimeria tenella]|eukprot:XP_013231411.1 hypothetical protein, conserved [Eimeria tenella]
MAPPVTATCALQEEQQQQQQQQSQQLLQEEPLPLSSGASLRRRQRLPPADAAAAAAAPASSASLGTSCNSNSSTPAGLRGWSQQLRQEEQQQQQRQDGQLLLPYLTVAAADTAQQSRAFGLPLPSLSTKAADAAAAAAESAQQCMHETFGSGLLPQGAASFGGPATLQLQRLLRQLLAAAAPLRLLSLLLPGQIVKAVQLALQMLLRRPTQQQQQQQQQLRCSQGALTLALGPAGALQQQQLRPQVGLLPPQQHRRLHGMAQQSTLLVADACSSERSRQVDKGGCVALTAAPVAAAAAPVETWQQQQQSQQEQLLLGSVPHDRLIVRGGEADSLADLLLDPQQQHSSSSSSSTSRSVCCALFVYGDAYTTGEVNPTPRLLLSYSDGLLQLLQRRPPTAAAAAAAAFWGSSSSNGSRSSSKGWDGSIPEGGEWVEAWRDWFDPPLENLFLLPPLSSSSSSSSSSWGVYGPLVCGNSPSGVTVFCPLSPRCIYTPPSCCCFSSFTLFGCWAHFLGHRQVAAAAQQQQLRGCGKQERLAGAAAAAVPF